MLLSRARDLPFSALSLSPNPNLKQPRRKTLDFPMRTALGLLRSISASSLHPYRQLFHHHRLRLICNICLLHSSPPAFISFKNCRLSPFASLANSSASVNTLVEQVVYESDETRSHETWDFSNNTEVEAFDFDGNFGLTELKQLRSPSLEVKELEELPELWRRSKLAWLCKELPAHKASTVVRILNAQRKWMTQEDATYVAVHCMRIRENESGYRVYKWMMQQRWFRFDFALATKLADYMGRERKYLKCREIFDDIINQGIVPNESTFHILTVSYLSSNVQGCLEEACNIYNRMIQLGDYNPRLSLHNSLFRALVSQKPGGSSKNYLKQAEFIFHNLSSSGLEIHKDIYGGLIWLHSYQEEIDKKRISEIRAKMEVVGIEEGREVLVSILRAFSKDGDVEEVERIWTVLITNCTTLPSQAFVYKMQAYAKIGEPMKSLEIFRGMNVNLGFTSVAAYHKMIEILCKSQKLELAESIMSEFISSGLKPLMPSFVHLMDVYLPLGLHDKLEKTFLSCLEKCRPNRYIYCIYLDSLVKIGNLDHAELIFGQMYSSGEIGVNPRSCNAILRGYLFHGEYLKAEKIYDLMCEKKFDIETPLMQKMDYVLSLSRKIVKKPTSMKLNEEQREILVGLLLGGLRIQSDEARRNHVVCFQFNEKLSAHSVLKRHIYDQYHEWLSSSGGIEDVPYEFTSISHSYFGFYADQFWPKGHPAIPKLIHRWLSPRVLAYWYMYGGHRTPSGDILLKVKSGSEEGVEKIVKALKAKSLDCRVKKKGKVFWLGFLGNVSSWFWKLIEPFVLDDLKDVEINFDSGSDSDDS